MNAGLESINSIRYANCLTTNDDEQMKTFAHNINSYKHIVEIFMCLFFIVLGMIIIERY